MELKEVIEVLDNMLVDTYKWENEDEPIAIGIALETLIKVEEQVKAMSINSKPERLV